MGRYLKLFIQLGKISVMSALEYRTDFWVKGGFKVLESAVGFLIIVFLFSRIDEIVGWNNYQVLLISLTYTLTAYLGAFFILPGLKQFAKDLNRGDIDKYLTKPVNLQAYATLSWWDWSQAFRIVAAIIGIMVIVNRFAISISFSQLAAYLISIIVSIFLLYSFAFTIISSVLWLKRVRNIDYLAIILWDQGKMPTSIYGTVFKIVYATIIPLWFAATVPIGVLTGKYSLFIAVYGVILAGISLFVSNLFLKYGIRRYTGAGG